MPISNLSAFNSAIVPGYVQGESLQADLVQRQEQARQARMQTQEMMDERLALGALGKAFGMAPPPPPMPQGAGQSSVPATSTGAPIVPPGGQFGVQAPPGGAAPAGPPTMPAPQGGPPPPPQATAPVAPGQAGPTSRPPWATPQPQPAPALPPQQAQPAAPSIPPQIQQNLGQMTTEQLAQRIIAANPGIQDRPDLLVRAMAKGQALLAPDAKATLALLQIDQRLQAAETKVDIARMNNETKEAIANQLADVRQKIEGLKQQGADDRQAKALQEKIDELTAKLQAKHEDVTATNLSREKIAGGRTRQALEKEATKAGIKVDSSWTDQELQAKTAEAIGKKTTDAILSDTTADFMADLVIADPAQASHIGGYGATGQMNRSKVWTKVEQKMSEQGRPAPDLAAAKVAILGASQEARTIGAQAGSVALGTAELKQFAPLVQAASDAAVRTNYPTVNAIEQAFQRKTGGTQIITLHNQIQALKNAYSQILVRGGRSTNDARKQASETVDEAWSNGQIGAALKAMDQEAVAAGKGAAQAGADLRQKVSDEGGTMVTDARKVARLRGAGDDKAYEKVRDDYLKRYGKHGGEEALRKALKDSAAPPADVQEPPLKDGKIDPAALQKGSAYKIGDHTLYWDGNNFVDEKPD